MNNIIKIRLRNAIASDVELCLEPEGTTIPFKSGEEIDVEISGYGGTSVEIVIGKSSEGFNLAFWPDKGNYSVGSVSK